MNRQFAIASAGRTASTSLFNGLVANLRVRHSVQPIWDFSPAGLLAETYAQDRWDFVVVKGETFHFVELLRSRERTTLVLLTRENHLQQIVSHLVSLRSGRFHTAGAAAGRAAPFRVGRHEFLFLAHMVLMTERYFERADLSEFDVVERWRFEDLVADLDGHLRRLGVAPALPAPALLGVGYDGGLLLNGDEVLDWARALEPEGLRVGSL